MHQIFYFGTDVFLRLEMRAAPKRLVSKSRTDFTLLTPVKNRGGWERMLSGMIE